MTKPHRARRVLYYFGGHHVDSGSPKALLGLIDLLDRSRVAPLFLASGEGPLVAALEARGVEILRWPKPEPVTPGHPLRGLAGVARHARLLRRHRVDIVHVNEFGWNFDLVIAAWLRRAPVVLHVHLPDSIERNNLHRFFARRVLVVSEAQKSNMRHFERIASKTEVMYNAVDLDRFRAGHSLRGELGLSTGDVVVGSLAQLRKGKGIDVLLGVARELIPRYQNLVFLVAGRLGHGEEEFGKAAMREAEGPEFQGRFRFLGSRQDVPNLLATFDLFVLPTRAETFGIAVVEAMAAGVPVVATRLGAIEEIVTSPELGRVVDAVDVPSFARAIEELILLPDRGRSLGERGRASLAGRLDRASLAARIHGIYDGLR